MSLAAPTPYTHDYVGIARNQDIEDKLPSHNTTVDPRQLGAVIEAGNQIASTIGAIVGDIQAGVNADNNAREAFTQGVVASLWEQNSNFNYVIVHTKHETQFDGKKGVDWGHDHREFDIKVGGTIGYEIYWFKSGTLIMKGDGGFINWAYYGRLKSKTKVGRAYRYVFNAA